MLVLTAVYEFHELAVILQAQGRVHVGSESGDYLAVCIFATPVLLHVQRAMTGMMGNR